MSQRFGFLLSPAREVDPDLVLARPGPVRLRAAGDPLRLVRGVGDVMSHEVRRTLLF